MPSRSPQGRAAADNEDEFEKRDAQGLMPRKLVVAIPLLPASPRTDF
jgi:hypothetical protein